MAAGVELRGGFGPGGFGDRGSTDITAALRYSQANRSGTRWALIVSSEQEAAPFAIKGESVAAMGGFTGRETVLTPSYLASLLASGEARYFLLGGGGFFGRGGNNAAVATITSVCSQVPASAWAGRSATSSGALYDCAQPDGPGRLAGEALDAGSAR